jgi:hypothetical protein
VDVDLWQENRPERKRARARSRRGRAWGEEGPGQRPRGRARKTRPLLVVGQRERHAGRARRVVRRRLVGVRVGAGVEELDVHAVAGGFAVGHQGHEQAEHAGLAPAGTATAERARALTAWGKDRRERAR